MLAYQDIKILSVTLQTSAISLQNCRGHYDLSGLATWPFLCFLSGAAFVNGDVTGTKVGPFLLNANFRRGVGDWLWIMRGRPEGPLILPVGLETCQHVSQLCLQTLWGHLGLRGRGSMGHSNKGGVVGTSHRCGVLKNGVQYLSLICTPDRHRGKLGTLHHRVANK